MTRSSRAVSVCSALLAALCAATLVGAGGASAAPRAVQVGDVIRGAAVEWGCTITATGTVPQGRSRVHAVLTAGHCFGSSERGTGYAGHRGSQVWGAWDDLLPVGRLANSSVPRDVGARRPEADADVAVVRLDRGVRAVGALRHGVGRVHSGDRVCKKGRVTGTTCGRVVSADEDFIVAEVNGFYGDSGSPAYDSSGALVGMLSRADVALTAKRAGGVPFIPGSTYVVFETIDRVGLTAWRSTGFWLDGLGPVPEPDTAPASSR